MVNNGNPDHVSEKLQKMAEENEKVKLVEGQGNIGFAAGCNLGSKEVKGEYIVILKAGCIFLQDDTFIKIAHELKETPQVIMAGARVLDVDGNLLPGNKLNLVTMKTLFSQFTGIHHFAGMFGFKTINAKENENDTETEFVDGISSRFVMMKTMKYRDNGGFDEHCFLYAEDMELCMRMYKRGQKIFYIPSLRLIRLQPGREMTNFLLEQERRDSILHYFVKHYRWPMPPLYKKPFHDIIYRLTALIIKITSYIRSFGFLFTRSLEKAEIADRKRREESSAKLLLEKIKTLKSSIKTAEPILLTQATGQIGVRILRRLMADKVETIALYKDETLDFNSPDLSWIQGSLTSGKFNLGERKIKTVIHTGEVWQLDKHLKKFSELGAKRLICFTRNNSARSDVPRNKYERQMTGAIKSSEQNIVKQCEELGINYTILRPAMVYGDGLDRNITPIARFIKRFRFYPIYKLAGGSRRPVHGEDVAEVAVKIVNMRKTFGKTYDLAGPTKVTFLSIIKDIFPLIGAKERVIAIPALPVFLDIASFLLGRRDVNGEFARGMNVDMVYNDSPAKDDIDFRPREFSLSNPEDIGA